MTKRNKYFGDIMNLKTRKYGNSLVVILPAKVFKGIKEVWVYKEEQLSDSELLKRVINK